ncbi:hypothetical protein LCGC14_0266830 [marine sediment metagenome]|uniref:MarR family transcriptional regulator n=1 Tax=marine sediment metagenome TaxID=412755 RepID=A0A0F9UGL4_9ZZZZ
MVELEAKDVKRGVELYLHYYGLSTLNEIADNLDISGLVVMLSIHDLVTDKKVVKQIIRPDEGRRDINIPGHYYQYVANIDEM